MRIQFCLCFVVSAYLGNAQGGGKIDGIYFGKIIDSENALVISTKDTTVAGFLYLNQFERFQFVGNFSRGLLKGASIVKGEELLVIGRPTIDSLKINLISISKPSEIKQISLFKATSNPKKDINSVFAKGKPEHDDKLIGAWVALKSLNAEGKDVLAFKYQQEFRSNGFISFSGSAVDKIINSDRSKKIILPSYSWHTKAGRIVVKRIGNMGGIVFAGPDEDIYPYEILGDTLIMANPKAKNYYIRKRRK